MRCLLAVLLILPTLVSADALVDGRMALQMGDYNKAYELLEPLASAGNPRAEFYLSLMYQDGLGIPADPAHAQRLLQQAAKGGDPMAQYNLANRLLSEGNEADARRAADLYRRAAKQGLVLAQHNLGSLYALGKGVSRDLKEARRWYAMAAENGSHRSAAALVELERLVGGQTQDGGAETASSSRLIIPDQQWFDHRGRKEVTLQLLATSRRDEAEALYRQHQWQRDVLLYRANASTDKPLWALGYGVFPSSRAAKRALTELPEALRKNRPWARNLRELGWFVGH